MSDPLRHRFDALRSAVEHTDNAGLDDVRVRRTRRARNRVAAATAASVAVLALTGVVVLPQLNPDPTSSSAARDAEVGADSAGSAGSDPIVTLDQPTLDQMPPEVATSDPLPPGDVETASPQPAPVGPFDVTADSLLSVQDIEDADEAVSETMPYGASLTFPPLCVAGSSYDQYSVPAAVYSAAWELSDGRLNLAVVEYETDQKAADAFARLVTDSQSCPVFNEFGSIQFTGSDTSVGDELAFFDLRAESGQDGSIRTSAIAVTRIANVLAEIVLAPDGAAVGGSGSRRHALAEAAVSRIVASG